MQGRDRLSWEWFTLQRQNGRSWLPATWSQHDSSKPVTKGRKSGSGLADREDSKSQTYIQIYELSTFSCTWKLTQRYCASWRRTLWELVADVSDNPAGAIFKRDKGSMSFRNLRTYQTTPRHSPEQQIRMCATEPADVRSAQLWRHDVECS
jgi:hypothetical protein